MIGPEKLTDIVNQSGFPLQIGIQTLVTRTVSQHGWRVLYQEHSWINRTDGSSGFLDLVLEDRHKTSVLLVECKRVLETVWTFLLPGPRITSRRHAKAWVTYHNAKFKWFDWFDLALDPQAPESAFCVVPGQDSRARPMLERIGAELVSATEGVAEEERLLQSKHPDSLRMYFSIIVTTAKLSVCVFDGDTVSLADGTLSDAQFHEAPYVRFRKQLSTRVPNIDQADGDSTRLLAKAKEHTVFVVNSEHLLSFLSGFEVDDGTIRQLLYDR